MSGMYKDQLHKYADRRHLSKPRFVTEQEGPSHIPSFKGKVTFQGKPYSSTEVYQTQKAAQNEAAKVALAALEQLTSGEASNIGGVGLGRMGGGGEANNIGGVGLGRMGDGGGGTGNPLAHPAAMALYGTVRSDAAPYGQGMGFGGMVPLGARSGGGMGFGGMVPMDAWSGGGMGFDGRLPVDAMPTMSCVPIPLPPYAFNTLYAEGLPSNITFREVNLVFRPYKGYKEARLVCNEFGNHGGDPIMVCFVDFTNPTYAAMALSALQGFEIDQHDSSTALRLHFMKYPGPSSCSGSGSGSGSGSDSGKSEEERGFK